MGVVVIDVDVQDTLKLLAVVQTAADQAHVRALAKRPSR